MESASKSCPCYNVNGKLKVVIEGLEEAVKVIKDTGEVQPLRKLIVDAHCLRKLYKNSINFHSFCIALQEDSNFGSSTFSDITGSNDQEKFDKVFDDHIFKVSCCHALVHAFSKSENAHQIEMLAEILINFHDKKYQEFDFSLPESIVTGLLDKFPEIRQCEPAKSNAGSSQPAAIPDGRGDNERNTTNSAATSQTKNLASGALHDEDLRDKLNTTSPALHKNEENTDLHMRDRGSSNKDKEEDSALLPNPRRATTTKLVCPVAQTIITAVLIIIVIAIISVISTRTSPDSPKTSEVENHQSVSHSPFEYVVQQHPEGISACAANAITVYSPGDWDTLGCVPTNVEIVMEGEEEKNWLQWTPDGGTFVQSLTIRGHLSSTLVNHLLKVMGDIKELALLPNEVSCAEDEGMTQRRALSEYPSLRVLNVTFVSNQDCPAFYETLSLLPLKDVKYIDMSNFQLVANHEKYLGEILAMLAIGGVEIAKFHIQSISPETTAFSQHEWSALKWLKIMFFYPDSSAAKMVFEQLNGSTPNVISVVSNLQCRAKERAEYLDNWRELRPNFHSEICSQRN